jgi:adenosylcobinamide kinase/adenosylcobinamide-phosphate guanylyltransferase
MLTLVSGGSASGKSEYAEGLATAVADRPRLYIATMQVYDAEGEARVARHRAMRAEKGFETLECPEDLLHAPIPAGCTALLECLSNLAANECFGEKGFPGVTERILAGIDRLCRLAGEVVIVTNEVFSDGIDYGETTEAYLSVLAALNRAAAARADRVVEVVCGIPVVWKDGKK